MNILKLSSATKCGIYSSITSKFLQHYRISGNGPNEIRFCNNQVRRHSNLPENENVIPNGKSAGESVVKSAVEARETLAKNPFKALQTYAKVVDEATQSGSWFRTELDRAVGLCGAVGIIHYWWVYFFGAATLNTLLNEVKASKESTREFESGVKEDVGQMKDSTAKIEEDVGLIKAGMVKVEEYMRIQSQQENVYKPRIPHFLWRPGQSSTVDFVPTPK